MTYKGSNKNWYCPLGLYYKYDFDNNENGFDAPAYINYNWYYFDVLKITDKQIRLNTNYKGSFSFFVTGLSNDWYRR